MDVINPRVLLIAFLMVIPFSFDLDRVSPGLTAAGESSDYDLTYNETLYIPVDETLIWRNISVLMENTIYIEGTLKAYNTSVVFDIPFDPGVTIMINGTLMICDNDGDPSTLGDSSVFIGDDNSSNTIVASALMGNLFVNNSEMNGFTILDIPIHVNGSRLNDCVINSPRTSSTFKRMNLSTKTLGTGITLTHNYPWQISSINITGYKVGIRMNAGELRLFESSIYRSTSGILVDEGASLILTDCTIEGSSGPIEAYGSATLIRTVIIDGRIRFHNSLGYVHDSTFINLTTLIGIRDGIIRNSVFDSCRTAIEGAVGTLIILNRIQGSIIGISDPEDCTIYYNNFKDNIFHADGSIDSTWYNKTFLEGNYWSTYRGLDDGSNDRRANDGIGDTDIPYLSRDPYPLMMEDYRIRPSIPEMRLTYSEGLSDVLLRFDGSPGGHFITQRSTDIDFLRDLTSWSTSQADLLVRSNPNTTLYFRVGSYNEFGSRGWSLPSSVIVDDRPVPPIGLSAESVVEGSAINISWTYQGEDVREVVLKVRNILENTGISEKKIPYPVGWYLISDLENDVPYEIHLIAIDEAGHHSIPSKSVNAVPVDLFPPPPPKNIAATPLSNESISLEWAPSSIKDLEGFIIFRRDPGSTVFEEIGRTGWNGYSFTDINLMDNTTYDYGIRSMDNDGPMSEMVGPITVRTDHNNRAPEMLIKNIEIELIEDEGPGSLDLRGIFIDEDGDEITIEISETHMYDAEIRGDILWVYPEPDQEGAGYVQLLVSDGEAAVPYYIGIFVDSRPDSPRGVKILDPVKGSIFTPGLVYQLKGFAYDPDIGDYLTVSWSSDRDGVLTTPVVIGSITNLFTSHVTLSPGIHNITLVVWDSAMGYSYDNTTIAVSLWGFSLAPWDVVIDDDNTNITTRGGTIRIKITNGGPILLTFICNGTLYLDSSPLGIVPLGKRIIVLQPDTTGTILFNIETPLQEGEDITLQFNTLSETFNGTYAGEASMDAPFTVEDENVDTSKLDIILMLFGIIVIILIAIISAFVYIQFRKRDDMDDLEGVN